MSSMKGCGGGVIDSGVIMLPKSGLYSDVGACSVVDAGRLVFGEGGMRGAILLTEG